VCIKGVNTFQKNNSELASSATPSNCSIHIIANAAFGTGISGGDRIFIECARRWGATGFNVCIYSSEDGLEMCKRNKLSDVKYICWSASKFKKFGFFSSYSYRVFKGCKAALRLTFNDKKNIVYSASDFWPDFLPALILKLRFRKRVKWVAGFYLLLPNPFRRDSFYSGSRRLKAIMYFLSQKISYPIVLSHADMIFVTNDLDRQKFVNKRLSPESVVAVKGGIDTKTPLKLPNYQKLFDAIFIGRLCLEKGVRELVDIWEKVCQEKPAAKLAVLGDGPLKDEVIEKINKKGLSHNIKLFGFIDGIKKFEYIKQSKIVLHPSIIDSGGMAACEAMICGLPGVSFDIPALRSYYPKGMIKTPCYSLDKFANNILKLLNDSDFYKKVSNDAVHCAMDWDWDKRCAELLGAIST